MPVATPATPTAPFEIKSANLPLVALLLKSTDLDAIARELTQRFGEEPDFFDQDALLIDLSPLQDDAADQTLANALAAQCALREPRFSPAAERDAVRGLLADLLADRPGDKRPQ